MCGILCVISESSVDQETREKAYQRSRLQRHRGPDETGIAEFEKGIIVQERLALIGIDTGKQPFVRKTGEVLAANCEIYNWKELCNMISSLNGCMFRPRSDAEVILELYAHYGEKCVEYLEGMFGFVIYDKSKEVFLIARDRFGIIPLYIGYDTSGRLWAASEMKCLVGVCNEIELFEAGTYMYGKVKDYTRNEYYKPEWCLTVPTGDVLIDEFRQQLRFEVEQHLPDGEKVALLLSGDPNSSIIAGITQKLLQEGGRSLRTYIIGVEGSPDLEYGRKIAEHIGSEHVEVLLNANEGIYAIREVIWYLETYDVDTIRSGIPMYLLARRIKKDGFKAILSGEGADKIFGECLYSHSAPSSSELHWETVRRIMSISYVDCLRTNKSMLAWGVEARVPLLSSRFIDYVMGIKPEIRAKPISLDDSGRIWEENLLQKAFCDTVLPSSIVWKQNKQFSCGCRGNWIDKLKEETSKRVSDEEFFMSGEIYEHNTPNTKEEFYYRKLYSEMFGESSVKTVQTSVPKVDWKHNNDSSEQAQKEHVSTTSSGLNYSR
ncbi:asparagine synthase [Encephalitozoon hellem]|uniref:asparagine synthase (glutamine-hydrolyzing) n=1 Tax=Encephalitozoon hellem TaxID=27973 RepID=A0ABY8CKE9_ENCHE|nr:asparagine synthase [Encephalitozoon hellem]